MGPIKQGISLAGGGRDKLEGKVREIQRMRRTQPAIANFEDEGRQGM